MLRLEFTDYGECYIDPFEVVIILQAYDKSIPTIGVSIVHLKKHSSPVTVKCDPTRLAMAVIECRNSKQLIDLTGPELEH